MSVVYLLEFENKVSVVFLNLLSKGVVVGLTVQPVQEWKKGRYKLIDWLIDLILKVPQLYIFERWIIV